MSQTYTLTVVNNSQLKAPTFAVFAVLPGFRDNASLNLAWLTRTIDPGNQYSFRWEIAWGFAWSAQGTAEGYQWNGSGHLPGADPTNPERRQALFSYNDDFQLTYQPRSGTTSDKLWIQDDGSVPEPSKQESSVAVTLSGNPACALDAGPHLTQTFTLHPTYYIDAGKYVKGQMVDGASATEFKELAFTGGNTALTATLSADNTWDVQPSAT